MTQTYSFLSNAFRDALVEFEMAENSNMVNNVAI